MKLHLASHSGRNQFTGHGPGYVIVNTRRYENSVIVTPDQVYEERLATGFERLGAADFEFLRGLNPEIVLLGTGATLRFPPPVLSRPLLAAGIGFEVMSTAAACRTYNVLMAEGRGVVAALLLG